MLHNFNPSFSPPQATYPEVFGMGHHEDELCQACGPMPVHHNLPLPQPHILNQGPAIHPFADYSYSLEPPRSFLRPPLFPMPPSQGNVLAAPHVMFPNPPPMPAPGNIPDPRLVPMMPYEFRHQPPHFFLPPPPQVPFPTQVPPLPLGGPSGPGNLVNMSGGFNNQLRRQHSFPTGAVIPPMSPRHPRYGRSRPSHSHTTRSMPSLPQNNTRGRRSVVALGARSALMESFHESNKDKQWTLHDIFGYIVEFSRDQNGSRLIQQQLEETNEEDREKVFDEIFPEKTDMLIQDVFGNYIIQKFFELGTSEQKDALSRVIENNVVSYTIQIYACRVVQKGFECMTEEQQDRIINRLQNDVLACIKDDHGNHVIQKLIDSVAAERLTFLRIISENILELATNSNGCRVLQKCVLKLPTVSIQPVLDAIHTHTGSLMRDQYGNYVIQFILQNGADDDRVRIISRLRGSIVELAMNQYASHVCEKGIIFADALTRQLLIDEILTATTNGDHPIVTMMKDDFANYVLQTALMKSEGQQNVDLYHQVKTFLTPLRRTSSTYSKQLVKIERLVDKYFGKDKTPPGGHASN